jgi:hypothetical protein
MLAFSDTPWFGEDIVVLTNAERVGLYDPPVMEEIVDGLDRGWQLYAETTGREPPPNGPYFIDGRATIASVPETCGAGCAPLGGDVSRVQRLKIGDDIIFVLRTFKPHETAEGRC